MNASAGKIALWITISGILLQLCFSPAAAETLLQTGIAPPELTLPDLTGAEHSLSSYDQKKALLVLFWSSWSIGSAPALKRIEEFHKKHGNEVQVLGVATESALA